MTTQPNVSANNLDPRTAAKRRLRRKVTLALPLIFAASMLTGCLDYVKYTDERGRAATEKENEIITEKAREIILAPSS